MARPTARPEDMPVYRRIQEDLRAAIRSGESAPGSQLPSEADLTRRYGTTRATVVHALQGLVFEGLIKRRQGVGTFVANPAVRTQVESNRLGIFEHDMRASGTPVAYRLLDFGPDPATATIRERLGLRSHEPVYLLRRLRLVGDKPLGLETRYLAARYACRMPETDLGRLPVQDIFQNSLSLNLTHITNRIFACLADPVEARYLDVPPKSPLLVREHTQFADDTAVLWGKTAYREEYQVQYTTWRSGAAQDGG